MENPTVDFNSNELIYVNINSLITLFKEVKFPPLKKGLCKSSVPSTTWTKLRVKVMKSTLSS